jgi:hypothetical protein
MEKMAFPKTCKFLESRLLMFRVIFETEANFAPISNNLHLVELSILYTTSEKIFKKFFLGMAKFWKQQN